MSSYKVFPHKPKIEIGPNSFKITLPNTNYDREKVLSSFSNIALQNNSLTDYEKKVVDYLRTHKKASRNDIQIAIKKSQTFTIEL